MQTMTNGAYPVQFSVDYPDRPLNRLTTFFRLLVAIPILIVLGTVSGGSWQYSTWQSSAHTVRFAGAAAGGLLFLGPLLMLVFRRKYPRWWFDWNLELLRFTTASASTSPCWTIATPPPTSSRRSTSTSPTPTRSG